MYGMNSSPQFTNLLIFILSIWKLRNRFFGKYQKVNRGLRVNVMERYTLQNRKKTI